ncbi:MAG: hypothetical protein ACP5KD_09300 [Fervidobacterium sp.]
MTIGIEIRMAAMYTNPIRKDSPNIANNPIKIDKNIKDKLETP